MDDPCLDPKSHSIITSDTSNKFKYDLGTAPMEFWISFETEIEELSGVPDICGSYKSSLVTNSSKTDLFLTTTFNE